MSKTAPTTALMSVVMPHSFERVSRSCRAIPLPPYFVTGGRRTAIDGLPEEIPLRRALDYLAEAEGLLEKLGDRRRQSTLWSLRTSTHWQLGEHERGIEPGHRALDAALAVGDVQLAIGARFNLSLPHWGRGDYRRALGYVLENEGILSAAEPDSPDPQRIYPSTNHPAVANLAMAAWYLAELGEFGRAETYGQEAVRQGEALQPRPGTQRRAR